MRTSRAHSYLYIHIHICVLATSFRYILTALYMTMTSTLSFLFIHIFSLFFVNFLITSLRKYNFSVIGIFFYISVFFSRCWQYFIFFLPRCYLICKYVRMRTFYIVYAASRDDDDDVLMFARRHCLRTWRWLDVEECCWCICTRDALSRRLWILFTPWIFEAAAFGATKTTSATTTRRFQRWLKALPAASECLTSRNYPRGRGYHRSHPKKTLQSSLKQPRESPVLHDVTTGNYVHQWNGTCFLPTVCVCGVT